jgi:exodeoxyribonuclease VII large subunit
VERETDRLSSLRSRPVLASPEVMVTARHDDVERLKSRSHAAITTAVMRAADQLVHLKAQVLALSPQKTLDRGYAVVQLAEDQSVPGARREVVRHPSQAPAGAGLTVRVAGGKFTAQSTGGHVPAHD